MSEKKVNRRRLFGSLLLVATLFSGLASVNFMVTSPGDQCGTILENGQPLYPTLMGFLSWHRACDDQLQGFQTAAVMWGVIGAVALITGTILLAFSGSGSGSRDETASRDLVEHGRSDYKRCPLCAEEIRAEATFCKHCRNSIG